MVASNSLDLPYYKGIGRQRGRGFEALSQIIDRSALSFVRKKIVPAAKRVSADLLQFPMTEVPDVASGKKSFQNCCQKLTKTDIEKTTRKCQAKEKHSS